MAIIGHRVVACLRHMASLIRQHAQRHAQSGAKSLLTRALTNFSTNSVMQDTVARQMATWSSRIIAWVGQQWSELRDQ